MPATQEQKFHKQLELLIEFYIYNNKLPTNPHDNASQYTRAVFGFLSRQRNLNRGYTKNQSRKQNQRARASSFNPKTRHLDPSRKDKLLAIHPDIFKTSSHHLYPKPMSPVWDSIIEYFQSDANRSAIQKFCFSFPPNLPYISVSQSFEEHMLRKIQCKDFLPADCTHRSPYGTMQRIVSYIINCDRHDNQFKTVNNATAIKIEEQI